MAVKRSKFLISAFVFSAAFLMATSPVVSAVGSTSFPAERRGYFSDDSLRAATDGQGFVIKDVFTNDTSADGIPAMVNTVEEFIDFIEVLYRGGSSWGGYTTKNRAENRIGAMYIIQTMRASGSSFDRNYPDESDLNEWKEKVRSYVRNGGTILWAEPTSSYVNNSTPNSYRGRDNGGNHDVSWYPHAGSSSPSGMIIFRHGNTIDYMIKRNCGNPMGNISDGLTYGSFSLTPSISVTGTVTGPSETVTFNPSVTNGGNTTARDTDWQINLLTVPSGRSTPTGGNSSSSPCSYYQGQVSGITCSNPTITGGGTRGTTNFAAGTHNFTTRNYVTGDLPVGTKLCFVLSVEPRAHNSSQWRHSTPACVVVGKKPKVQILGGDLWVGRTGSPLANIITSTTTINANTTYGSYSEYAIAASGAITGMASGSGYARGASTNVLCSLSLLTFNNADNGSCSNATVGRYTKLPSSAPNIAGRFSTTSTSPAISGTVSLSSQSSGVYRAGNTNQISLSSATIPRGRWIVLNAPGNNVRITGNIQYASTALSSVNDIPQVVIIANNIAIDESVTRVDAWLIAVGSGANGIVNTCSATNLDSATPAQLATRLNADRCNDRLTVNGPVMANHLLLRRTAGSGTGSQAGTPGETFNFRPDAYLWLMSRSGAGRGVPTVLTRELPPRY